MLRVVAVGVEREAKRGKLFHHTFFLATNFARPQAISEHILQTCRQRAVARTRIGERTRVIAPKPSSAQRNREGAPHRKRKVGMAGNEVTLLLAAIAYQLLHALRCLLESATGNGFFLDRVRERVLKVAASLVRHARMVHFRITSIKAALWRRGWRHEHLASTADRPITARHRASAAGRGGVRTSGRRPRRRRIPARSAGVRPPRLQMVNTAG